MNIFLQLHSESVFATGIFDIKLTVFGFLVVIDLLL